MGLLTIPFSAKTRGCGKFFWRFWGEMVKMGKATISIPEGLAMDPMPKMSREEFVGTLRSRMEAMLGQVADAINEAPDGYVIAGSEEKVRDLFGELRQQAFEMGLQMRINAAQAAFPPSEAPGDGQAPPQ
jgi:hypothetical protein